MKTFFGRLVLLAVSILLTIAIVDVILERLPDKNKFEPVVPVSTYSEFNVRYGIEPKPNLNYQEYGFTVHTNSEATFGPDIKRDGTPIIMHLGDSYTAGPGIAYETNYPHLLQEKINASSSAKYQSVILGMGGSSPTQQEIIFHQKLNDLKPKLTIYELYDNDLSDDYAFRYSQYRAKIEVYEKIPSWLKNTALGKKMYVFVSDLRAKEYEKKYEATKQIMGDDPNFVWSSLMQPALENIKKEAESRGSSFMFFYIPSGWEIPNEYSTQSARALSPVHEYAQQWANEKNIPYVDLYEPFMATNTAKLNELYLDDTRGFHLTETGTQIVTDHLYDLIEKNHLLPQ